MNKFTIVTFFGITPAKAGPSVANPKTKKLAFVLLDPTRIGTWEP